MIKALILDFGGVVVTMPPDAPSARAVAADLGLSHQRLMQEVFSVEDWLEVLVGAMSAQEFDRRLRIRFGLPLQPAHPSLLQRIFADEQLSTGLLALADSLRPSCQIALLSNASDDLEERTLRGKLGIFDRFDLVVISAQVGMRKPDLAIYELTLERLGVAPHAAIFVDDMPANVEAAAALGIHAIRFQSEPQAIAAIQQRLASNSVNRAKGGC